MNDNNNVDSIAFSGSYINLKNIPFLFLYIKSHARMLLIDDHVGEDSIAKMSKK